MLQGRIDVLKEIGGDSIVMLGLFNELKRKKILCHINNMKEIDLSKIDIVHFFGIMRVHDLYPYFLRVRRQHKKIIVTPIYEDLSYLDKYGRVGLERFVANILPNDLKEFAKGLSRGIKDNKQLKFALLQFRIPYSKQQKELLSSADHIIVTSYGEMNDIIKKFALPKSKFDIIPICIEKEEHQVSKNLFFNKYGFKKIILCVGRIEPKKNQLGLIEALKDTKVPTVFIGNLSQYHKSYTEEFLKQVKKFTHIRYLGALKKNMLISAYKSAKVHVLASWFEVIGITNLEAAINGCNIVTTRNGYAKEYFGDFAWYCNPEDTDSIKKSVLEAYWQPVKAGLKKTILKKYTWDKIVPKILEVYRDVLKK